jgi:uncharacterized membrane protein
MSFIFSYFKHGIFILFPIISTVFIVRFFINLFSGWLNPLKIFLPCMVKNIPFIEFIAGFALFLLVGYIFSYHHLNNILDKIEKKIISKIPAINKIYMGIKQILHLITKKKDAKDEEQVAWVRLPYRDIYCLGFMTGNLPREFCPRNDETFYCFFIPHTPNPITGYFITASSKDCIFTTLTKEEAMSLIISGGIIKPNQKNQP